MAKKYPTEPSELFIKSLQTAGTLVADCELCGRVHFASEGDYDVVELEELKRKAASQPNRYIEVNNDDFVSYTNIDGKQAVIACPCHGLRKYEDLFLGEKSLIVDYLTRVNEEEATREKDRKEEAKALKKLSK